jgi:threonine-phosphate decarboxylase
VDRYHHGGEIYGQAITYDFSVNVNPLGMPKCVQAFLTSEQAIYYAGIYPQNGNEQLAEAISQKNGIKKEHIVCGNGASELIYALFAALPPQKVLLCAPGFSAYEQAAALYGWEIIYYDTKEEFQFQIKEDIVDLIKESKPELIVLCNPANPVGNCIKPDLLEEIVDNICSRGTKLLIDECFLDFLDSGRGRSAQRYFDKVNNTAHATIMILKAFTKIYAMAGLRLGYLFASDNRIADSIRYRLPEWNVSTIAQQAGMLALADDNYLEQTRDFIKKERFYLEKKLRELALTVYDGEANFILWKARSGLKEILLEQGILIRDCSNYRGLANVKDGQTYYRTAIRSPEENEKLFQALHQMIS